MYLKYSLFKLPSGNYILNAGWMAQYADRNFTDQSYMYGLVFLKIRHQPVYFKGEIQFLKQTVDYLFAGNTVKGLTFPVVFTTLLFLLFLHSGHWTK